LLETQGVYWIIPARWTIGLALLWPLGDNAQSVVPFCRAVTNFASFSAEFGCGTLTQVGQFTAMQREQKRVISIA
jgi:hypothetical protein